MKFELTVLGSGSALPRLDRHPSAHLLNVQEQYFLIDCGEGTQLELKRAGIKIQRIHHIFISHLHGDHYLGLMGLLATFHLLGRERELHIHAPPELEEILKFQMDRTGTELRFPINFHSTKADSRERIYENEKLVVDSIPLRHRIHCTGFLFKERPKLRKISKEKLEQYDIPIKERQKLKEGKDVEDRSGKFIDHRELTLAPSKAYSYAYCSDTAYMEDLHRSVENVDLLYHDATFMEELRDRAAETFHSTASQAARVARDAGVGQLLLGHFSARYRSTAPFKEEAERIFPRVLLASDGMRLRVDQE